MNKGNFKSSLSSNLEFRLEYCCHRFTDLHNLRNLSNNANGHFTLATLPFCNLTSILKLETICIFEFQRLEREMNLKGKANHVC